MSPAKPHVRERSGIALIIVLGFLALLTVLVVAFAVMMRTERIASRNYSDAVRAKQMVQVGVARVQAELDAQAGVTGGGRVQFTYPPWDTMNSAGPMLNTNFTDALISGDATNFLPLSVLSFATSAAVNAGWTNIYVTNDTLVGRIAYTVVNCSGMLDMNFVGGATKRYGGSSPSEISISNAFLPEFIGTAPVSFPPDRATRTVHFESMPDLMVGARSFYAGAPGFPSNSFIYSRAPNGYLVPGTDQVRTQLWIGGDSAYIASKQPEILSAFGQFGDVPDTLSLFRNLLDYVDTDQKPIDQGASFGTEAVPMVNEVVLIVSNQSNGAGAKFFFTPRVELFFPFAGITNKSTFKLQVGIIFSGTPVPATYKPPNYNVTVNTIKPSSGDWTQGIYYVTLPGDFGPAIGLSTNPVTSWGGLKAGVLCRLTLGGDTVDQVAKDASTMLNIDLSGLPMTASGYNESYGMACNDPRFNYDVNNINIWKPVGATPGASGRLTTLSNENVGVVTYATDPTADGTNLMYVRDSAMTNTGELGFLAYDPNKPWHTIRLLDDGAQRAHRVYDYFTVHTNGFTQGLVNPNAKSIGVLMSTLWGACTNFSPTPDGFNGWNVSNEVANFATGIRTLSSSMPMTNISDIGIMGASGFWPAGAPKWFKESVVRHSADLWSARQNMYTVFIAGQALRREPGKASDALVDDNTEVVAEQRAVAVIWRDPFPVNGVHEQRVVFFKWLPD